jgi:nucleotide-binding universal stress UspA family protein
MKKVEKILAPTDLSELSRVGLEYALELARGWGAEVTVYHVANAAELASYKAHSMEDLLNKHRKTLGQFLNDNFAELLPLVEVRQKVEIGSAAASILEEAEREGSDLYRTT